ncbi:MAG TPA: hypothetical protein DCO77_05985 [Nitrospiraceae bacterium]|nr:hypothetical protein [Nitrospiraceae bacterium]
MPRRLYPFTCSLLVLLSILPGPAAAQLKGAQTPPAGSGSMEPTDTQKGQLTMPGTEEDGEEEEEPSSFSAKEAKQDKDGPYIIKRGDTLWDISSTFLKDPFLWPLIWKVNPYIKNPDLIYPGNKLAIPSLAPIEQALEAPGERRPEKAIEEEEAPPTTPGKPRKPVEEEEEAPPPRRVLILPEERKVPIINKYSMLNAGFIANQETDDHIVGALEEKSIYSYDDIVFIKVRDRREVKVGDRFVIYAPLHKVKHPRTGRKYGRLIKILGVLQVTATDAKYLTSRITLSFDSSEKGDMIAPYQEPVLIYDEPKQSKNLKGYILEIVDGRTINALADIVYLDVGGRDGVEPGDRFNVYVEPRSRSYPKKLIGEVQVFLVRKRTSTAIVTKSVDTLAKGDLILSGK